MKHFKFAVAVIALAAMLPCAAQDYPKKPVTLEVGYAAGGVTDLVARMVANGLNARLKQAFVVYNKPGANGTIAAKLVIASPADGYTLLVTPSGAITLDPSLRKPKPYEPLEALVPVAIVARFPFILVAGPSQPFNTMPEMIAYAKANPGKLSYASAGIGGLGHLGGEYLKMRAGIDVLHVPYKGDGASLPDLFSGAVSFNMLAAPTAIPLVQSGRLKALATMASMRTTQLPNVPTAGEEGLAGYEIGSWIGVFAPAGTPRAIVEKLAAEIDAAFAGADLQKQLANGSMTHDSVQPMEFAALIRRETAQWKDVAEHAKITLTD